MDTRLDCTVCGRAPGIWISKTDPKYYACDDCFSAAEHLRRYRNQPDNGVIAALDQALPPPQHCLGCGWRAWKANWDDPKCPRCGSRVQSS